MSAGPVLIMITEHLRSASANPTPTTRENILMSTATRLAAVLDKMYTDLQASQAELQQLKADATEKDTSISDLEAKLKTAEAASSSGISEADAEAMIAKGESIVGHVEDPAPAEPQTP